MSLSDELNQALQSLRSSLPEIQGAVVASSDGLSIASSISSDPNRMAAMVATALGLGKRICDTTGSGQLTETSVSGTDGHVYIYAAGTKGVLAVQSSPGSNVGLIHLECRQVAEKIASILG